MLSAHSCLCSKALAGTYTQIISFDSLLLALLAPFRTLSTRGAKLRTYRKIYETEEQSLFESLIADPALTCSQSMFSFIILKLLALVYKQCRFLNISCLIFFLNIRPFHGKRCYLRTHHQEFSLNPEDKAKLAFLCCCCSLRLFYSFLRG